MNGFKLPQNTPQDLLLILDLIGVPNDVPLLTSSPQIVKSAVVQTDDSGIDSSDSEIASEDEIEADLIPVNYEDELQEPKTIPVSSDSSWDSDSDSDSESESSVNDDDAKSVSNHGLDEDDESGPAPTTGAYFQTKNEINETDVAIPDITEVDPDEVLEKVGEIMSVMDKIVIVKGATSERGDQGSERALDSDTLLVFDDRTVMGYVYETFGPTSQPLYQVKFSNSYPLDPARMQISRDVFHVPNRSNFVFLNQIKQMKGSDASNVYDEEPAVHELEFSDDEAEAVFKSSLKRKRCNSRAQSVASSRHSTPSPSQMRDQDMVDDVILKGNAYDEHGPYDLDFIAMSSRPPPIPYDDPYADEYPSTSPELTSSHELTSGPDTNQSGYRTNYGEARGRGNGRGHSGGRSRGRGREQEHDRHGDRQQQNMYSTHNTRQSDTNGTGWVGRSIAKPPFIPSYDPYIPRPLSPTSLVIANATGQLPGGSNVPRTDETWGYLDPRFYQGIPFQFGTQGFPPFVQPHINPRFASAFGLHMNMNMGLTPPQQNVTYERSTAHSVSSLVTSDWANERAAPAGAPSANIGDDDATQS